MRILVLGGTVFLGRAFVEIATARGHELCLLHRGKHFDVEQAQGAMAQCRHVLADRDGDLNELGSERFDAVFDTSGYVPRVVGQNVERLKERVGRWLFVSSVSVYADVSQPGVAEDAPLHQLADESVEEITGASYGGLKALCEQACTDEFGDRATIVRPGLIVGERDPSDRFGYWPWRVARGGRYAAPLPVDAPVQYIDVRDLAAFCLLLLEADKGGCYNATCQPHPFAELLQACNDSCDSAAEPVWLPPEYLLEQRVTPWMGLPLWIPEGPMSGMQQVSVQAARDAGMTIRPLAETVRSTLEYMESLDRPLRAGLTPELERELIGGWD